MELLDSDDMKRQLLLKSAKHREEIEGDVKLITESTEKIITNALIIGGSLALTYYLVRQISGSPKKKKHKSRTNKIKLVQPANPESAEAEIETEPASAGIIGQVGAALVSQASLFLLNIAKEKLLEYLQSTAEKKNRTA